MLIATQTTVVLRGRRRVDRPRPMAPSLSARTPVRRQEVSHPRLEGFVEQVDKVIDPIEQMGRCGQLNARELQAATIFRSAYETVEGSIGGTLDPDRIRGGGIPGSPPAERMLAAAGRLLEAHKWLYPRDYHIVCEVVGKGRMLAKVAAELVGGALAARSEVNRVSHSLHAALTELARRWLPERSAKPRARAWVPEGSATMAGDAGTTTERGTVAHASQRGVKLTEG